MDLLWLDVDQITGGEGVLYAVHYDVHLALQDEEVFLHYIVIVGLKVLAGQEPHQGKVHPGAFHQILGAALSETVLLLGLIDDKHFNSSFSPAQRPGAIHIFRVIPASQRASWAG